MTSQQIKAIGFFLAFYESDLIYIANFSRFKKKLNPDIVEYTAKGDHTFYSFLSEFKVARNVKKDHTKKLLKITLEWINTKHYNNPDLFADKLRSEKITHEKKMTSLASKILFLNNPQEILPIDNRVRESVNQGSNLYKDYLPLVKQFKINRLKEFTECLKYIETSATVIEKPFKSELANIRAIRSNRLLDKLLWSIKGELA